MKALIEKLQAGLDLNRGDVGYGVTCLLSEQMEAAQKARFLTALLPACDFFRNNGYTFEPARWDS